MLSRYEFAQYQNLIIWTECSTSKLLLESMKISTFVFWRQKNFGDKTKLKLLRKVNGIFIEVLIKSVIKSNELPSE